MKTYLIRWGTVLLAVLLMFASACAVEPPSNASKFKGKVKVTKRQGSTPAAATLQSSDGATYDLVMDEAGTSFVSVMHGQTAEIYGTAKGNSLKVFGYVDERVNAGHEFWRRMRCLACVVLPATINAALPPDLHGTQPLAGRPYDFKRRFTAWTRDGKFLWAAADNELLQFDLAGRKLVRSYCLADGLPDRLVYQLASDGKELRIVHRGGVAALVIGGDKIGTDVLSCAYANAVPRQDGGFVLIADTATPPIPTAGRITKAIRNGIWSPHWRRKTAHFITKPVQIDDRFYVGSFGDIYELDTKASKWTRIAENGYEQTAGRGKLYFLSPGGLGEYDPATGKTVSLQPPEDMHGRYTRFLVNDKAAWVAAVPVPAPGGKELTGGGLARFDLQARTWKSWTKINDNAAVQPGCLSLAQSGAMTVVTMDGRYAVKTAHPGMTYTKRQEFHTSGFCLHTYDEATDTWASLRLSLAELDKRLICGQDGRHGSDVIVPQSVEELSVGPRRIFAATRLVPRKYFGGYWPCVNQLASRPDTKAPWTAQFVHRPAQLDLQGEQPMVLNISTGQLTLIGSSLKDQLWEAIGHDLVLGTFLHDKTQWAVTESCVAHFDESADTWKKLAGPEFRWYWRATALLDDGRHVYIGSDRGLVTRLDTQTGRFEFQTALEDRTITRIVKRKDGKILAAGCPPPLGLLPVQLSGNLETIDADAASFDGKTWSPLAPDDVPSTPAPKWMFKQLRKRSKKYQDKTRGNYLHGPAPGDGAVKPRYYLTETFFPLFLAEGADASRMWVSTYTGILRLDLK